MTPAKKKAGAFAISCAYFVLVGLGTESRYSRALDLTIVSVRFFCTLIVSGLVLWKR
ncbi:MAG: hypothetical protein JO022_21900 [Acidobacteriaceae bacterium]|nr:hypothetical protein [Acidobacteriaceae bacterium]